MFQNGDDGTFSSRIGRQKWDVTAPQILGVFPAVARQVLRGDVRESVVDAVRNVHPASLFEGKLGFDDTVVQGYDDKELDSSKVPARALAAVRSVVQFTPQYADTPVFPLQLYRSGGHLVSATGQLRWHEADNNSRGFVMIDTPGTKAVVGFAEDLIAELDNVTIEPHSRFGTIYLTARDPRGTIASSRANCSSWR